MDSGLATAWRVRNDGNNSSYRLVHRHQLGAVRKSGFNLNFRNHFGYAVHHLRTGDDVRTFLHELGDRASVARAFENEIGDERDSFRVIELDAALEPASRHHRRHGDQKLIFFARCQIHRAPLPVGQFSQSRGSGILPNALKTAIRSRWSAAPSGATSRASAKPFQAETPTSPANSLSFARTAAT